MLRLICAQSLTVPLLAPVIRDWHRRRPQVVISLRESVDPDELVGSVDNGEADILVLPGPVDERLSFTLIAEEEIVLTAPAGHPLARQPFVKLPDLDRQRIVHFAPENGLSSRLDYSLSKSS